MIPLLWPIDTVIAIGKVWNIGGEFISCLWITKVDDANIHASRCMYNLSFWRSRINDLKDLSPPTPFRVISGQVGKLLCVMKIIIIMVAVRYGF